MRSFIAVKISSDQRNKIAELIRDFRRYDTGVKWVRPENMHITLKFLGEVDKKILPEIFNSLEKSLTNDQVFDFNLKALGCFPNVRRPRVIWVGIDRGANNLKALAAKVDSVLMDFGFEKEKRGFSAHLTIGRVKDPHGVNLVTDQFEKLRFDTEQCLIEEVVFFQSILKREGPTYIPHKIVKLKTSDKEG